MEKIIPMREEIIKLNYKSIEIKYHKINETIVEDFICFNIRGIICSILRCDNNFLVFEENTLNNIKIAEN